MKRVYYCLFFLVLMFFLANCQNPVGTLISISPDAKVSHMPAFILTVSGTDFLADSVIVFNGVEMATTFVDATELTCEINPGDIAAGPSTLSVLVRNPSPGGGDSNALNFTVHANHTFTSPQQISYTGLVFNFDLTVDDPGNINVVWQYEDYHKSYTPREKTYFTRSTDGGASWSMAENIYNGTKYCWHPKISVDGLGNLSVVGEDGSSSGYYREIYFIHSTDDGSTWSPLVYISDVYYTRLSESPNMAVDTLGNIMVAWNTFVPPTYNYDVFISRSTDSGSSWSLPVNISNQSSLSINSNWPQVVVDESGNINVVWTEADSGDTAIKFRRSSDNGSSWGSIITVVDTSGYTRSPQFASDLSGNLYMTWCDNVSGDDKIYFSRSTDGGGSWTSPIVLVGDKCSIAYIDIDSAPNINITYRLTYGGPVYIRSTDNGSTWSSPISLGSISVPQFDLDILGNIYIVGKISSDLYFLKSEH